MKSKGTIWVSLIIAVILLFVLLNNFNKDKLSLNNSLADISFASNESPDADTDKEEQSKAELESFKSGNKEHYSDSRLNFSFDYPSNFSVGSFKDGLSDVVILQEGNIGFQLYITPFDEESADITVERLKQDDPSIIIDSVSSVKFEDAQGLAFILDRKTREVWWVYRGHLYQITSYPEFDNVLLEILKTWKYK